MKHRLSVAAVMTVAAFSLAACGSSEPPTDASVEEFCTNVNDLSERMVPADGEELSESEQLEVMRDWEEKMREVGTPEGMNDDARAGFELVLETTADLDDDATAEDLANIQEDLTQEEKDQVSAYGEYVVTECVQEPTEAP